MQLFYSNNIQEEVAYLDANDSGHCIKTLRHKQGDRLHFTDGNGGLYEGIINEPDPKKCQLKIITKTFSDPDPAYHLHIAIAPTKNTDRFEWFVEKATEIGVSEITPLVCRHSERKKLRTDRLERIALAAMKQCLKTWKPKINDITSFKDFMSDEISKTQKLIAHLVDENPEFLFSSILKNSKYLVLIGPEGDFSQEELEVAINKGFKPVSLGNSRLRTETAGIVTAQIFSTWRMLNTR
jgi:16S rRNA (uracil1498-N3)-methyltransferase